MQTHQHKPLLIYTHGAGRLGNQLFAYAHLLAFLEEHPKEYDLFNFSFIPYATFLAQEPKFYPTEGTSSQRLLNTLAAWVEIDPTIGNTTILQEKVIVNGARLLHLLGTIAPQGQSLIARDIYYWSLISGERLDYLDLALPQTVAKLQQKAFSVLAGWGIRSWNLLEKHGEAIREKLSVHPRYSSVAQTFVSNLRQHYDFLIGVAIRQGDYRTTSEKVFKRFLYESDQYARWMQQATAAFADRGRVGFIVTADEPQNPQLFAENVHFATGIAGGEGHYLESLAELALCDLLMTTATTFGGWAAFAGNIPIVPLYDVSQTIQAESATHYLEAFKQFDAMGNKLW